MSDLEVLFLVLGVVYLWECFYWFRRGTVAFITGWGHRWRVMHPAALMGNQSGGIVAVNPLPPLGALLAGSQSPLSISPEGVYSYVAQCISPGWRPPQAAKYFRFETIKKIEALGKQVRVNGELLVKAGSPFIARHLADQVRRLNGVPMERRAAVIKEMLKRSLDTRAIRKRLKLFQIRSALLQTVTNLLFSYLFLILPLWIGRFGFRRDWIALLVVLLGLTTAAAILFNRACKGLYPDSGEERFTHWFMILLSPATAVRAHDALSRPLLEPFHPIAVAQVLLTKERFLEFSRKALRELRHPCLPLCPSTEPGEQSTERQARTALLEAVERFLNQNGADLGELTKPPVPADESSRSFCPHCHAQFTVVEGNCADCGGLALEPLRR